MSLIFRAIASVAIVVLYFVAILSASAAPAEMAPSGDPDTAAAQCTVCENGGRFVRDD